MKQLDQLKELKPKEILKEGLILYKDHSITVMFVIAFGLVGFSLLRLQSLSSDVAAQQSLTPEEAALVSDSEVEEPLETIKVDEVTVERLLLISEDTDVIIDSALPEDRINPF